MRPTVTLALAAIGLLSCSDPPTIPVPTGEQITLSQAQVDAMTTRAQQVAGDNPGNSSFRSFVDSTLEALQAGVQMQRLDVTTNLTNKPLYFIGIHRVINQQNGHSFSTWTLIGFEDPAAFANVVQTSGFAQSTNSTAPSSLSGAIGDGSGAVNGQLLQVNGNGSVTTWNYSTGSASFRSDPATSSCPEVNPSPATVCTLEVMHVTFNVTAAQSLGSSVTRQASVSTEVAVPAMRLTYTP